MQGGRAINSRLRGTRARRELKTIPQPRRSRASVGHLVGHFGQV